MDSIANRILKAKQYAEEKDKRIRVHSFEVDLAGEHDQHVVAYNHGSWTCECEEFALRNICAHVMAMEEIMGDAVEPATIKVGV